MPNYQNCNKVTYTPAGASTATVLIDLTADTVAANKMLSGTTAHDKSGAVVTGSISSKAAATYTPTTTAQTISAGQYLSGAQTIAGDANLVAENIKKDVTIFGVTGTHEGGGTPTPPATPTNSVIFYSPYEFKMKIANNTKNWNGDLQYSTNNSTWTTWNGTTVLTAVLSDNYYKIYLRGVDNTYLTGGSYSSTKGFRFLGSNIMCKGNLNTLLKWNLSGVTMASYAFSGLFAQVSNVDFDVTLPSTSLSEYCYYYMFYYCYNMTKAPSLPAQNLRKYCYGSMFYGCANLQSLPSLRATALQENCYRSMFYGCNAIQLSETQGGDLQTEYRIPSSGTGTTATNALNGMFSSTGNTFTTALGTPTINTTYYTSNTVIS